jgi:hypothetical protein
MGEEPSLDHVAYIQMRGPGQREAGRWMFTTNKVHNIISPWVLSVLSAGLLTPRRKYATARIFPTECPYQSGWQANDSDALAAVTMALSGGLRLRPTESVVLLQRAQFPVLWRLGVAGTVENGFAFTKEGNMRRLSISDSPTVLAAIMCSLMLACIGALLFATFFVLLAMWGANNSNKRDQSKRAYRMLLVAGAGARQDKEVAVEQRQSIASNARGNDEQLPSPVEMLVFALEEQAQKVRLKTTKLLATLAKQPKRQKKSKARMKSKSIHAQGGQPRSAETCSMDAKKAQYNSINLPHPFQIHWALTAELLTQFQHSLPLFLREASAVRSQASESELLEADAQISLSEFARAYHTWCFLKSQNVESIIDNPDLLEQEGFELVKQQGEELIGLRLIADSPELQSRHVDNHLSVFVERRCRLSRLETDRTAMSDFLLQLNTFAKSAIYEHLDEIGNIWQAKDDDRQYW